MRPRRPLPEGADERLRSALKAAKSKAEFQRIQCVWLRCALNMNAQEVAKAIGWQPTSVRRLQAQYLREGDTALKRVGRGGRRHQHLTEVQERQLLEKFLAKAEHGGLLEVREVQLAYEKAVGHPVAKSTVYRMLARQGWRKLAPRPRHPKADSERQEAFKKTPRTGR